MKYQGILFILLLSLFSCQKEPDTLTFWRHNERGSFQYDDISYIFPFPEGYTNFKVSWGDGDTSTSFQLNTSNNVLNHRYSEAGEYIVNASAFNQDGVQITSEPQYLTINPVKFSLEPQDWGNIIYEEQWDSDWKWHFFLDIIVEGDDIRQSSSGTGVPDFMYFGFEDLQMAWKLNGSNTYTYFNNELVDRSEISRDKIKYRFRVDLPQSFTINEFYNLYNNSQDLWSLWFEYNFFSVVTNEDFLIKDFFNL